jgi:signal transduction histidine kinase
MIEQLLDATRFKKDGTLELDPERNDLGALTDQILRELDDDSGRFRLKVRGNTSGTWDRDRLLQVLSNLIGNAVRHSPRDSPILIDIDGTSEDTLSLRVHNGGPAIPQELHPILFEPFRRAALHRRGEQGLGLGLYITRQLVRAHGGAVSFESSEQAGTAFMVSLPRNTPMPGDDEARGPSSGVFRQTTSQSSEDDSAR